MQVAKKSCRFLMFTCLVLLLIFTLIALTSEMTVGHGYPFWGIALCSGVGAFLFGIGAVFF